MKKLGKLTINPEKVIKNEELVNLRGGYECSVTVTCTGGSISCTGQVCERSALGGWVKCDGNKTSC